MSLADLEVVLAERPGALAELAEVLGAAAVNLEGGGVFTLEGMAVAHYLVDEPERGRAALKRAGLGPVTVNPVVTLRLDQERPGQLGAFTRRLAQHDIDIRVQYSDHDHRLVLVVDPSQYETCAAIAARWDAERSG